ncbi:hypothetical protein [Bradyrhizobium diazoefficiens]|uniref:hypothetical protein n=1 Tax=Bradyrhizobium diazoefficiens TaxID=1355477 RepID=UPI00272B4527|nr:hypothetical protein [Bradyrhizobium diazoefficiens]WLA57212.1 hypothetical protein QIH81_00270 [Bradyrhizobium diazoefficiens]
MSQNTTATVVALWGWRFQHQVIELKNAYEAARVETDRDLKRQDADWEELERKVAAGEASFIEEDDDGQVIYDHGDAAHERAHETEMVLRLIREAFTISLHHLLEREINKRMKVRRYDESKAYIFLKGLGLQPDEPLLTALRLTANVAKHSEGSSAQQLYNHRPDLFDTTEMQKFSHPPGYEYLKITDQTLSDFFDAVRRSGPQRRKGWA